MQARAFWKAVTMDEANFLDQLIALFSDNEIRYCVVGGQGVNAYVEPVVSLDLDLVVAADQLERLAGLFNAGPFQLKRFAHSLIVSLAGSDLRLQIQTDPRYSTFVQRASIQNVLGRTLPVASAPDVLQGKIWAAQDPDRRSSKRQKDLADIARLLEKYPELRQQVPEDILARLI
jgi:hypothetical protein